MLSVLLDIHNVMQLTGMEVKNIGGVDARLIIIVVIHVLFFF